MSGGPDNSGTPGGQNFSDTGAVNTPAQDNTGVAPAQPVTTQSDPDSIVDILRFDPFAGGQQPARPSKGAGAAASPGQAPPRSDVQPPAAPQPAVPPEGAPGSSVPAPPQVDPLAMAADRLAQAADRLGQAPQQQAPQQQADDIPAYIFDIPPQLLAGLSAEDPQQQQAAVQHLVAGTARAVHTNMVKAIGELKAAIPQMLHSYFQAHTYRENVRKDFYGQFPMLDNPHLAPTVASVTQQVMQEIVAQGGRPTWSPQLARAIADRVFGLIPGLRPGQPGAVAQPPQRPAPQPQQIFTPGARPAPANGLAEEVSDLLF